MNRRFPQLFACTAFLVATTCIGTRAHAQYPQVPGDVQRAADAAKAAADKRSDEAFAKAMSVVQEWEKKGKPYIPSAAKPEDLPQAKIPAFPGAEGGGMYSFGGRGGRVIVVTSLDDSGPGSFCDAFEAGGARLVVVKVAGILYLNTPIRVRAPHGPIARQTAPRDR